MMDFFENGLQLLHEVVFDDNGRVLALGFLIIVACLVQILRSSGNQKEKIAEAVKQAPKRVVRQVSEIADAVEEVKQFVRPTREKRFRKRDQVWFHGRKLIRRVEDSVKYVGTVGEKSQLQGKKMIKDLTKKMFLLESSDGGSSAGDVGDHMRPAEEWLEEEQEERRPWVPPELRYLLNSFHMFGQFDPAVFAEVYPSIETLRVSAGQFLFRIGDPDMYIFVVQSGRLEVTTTDNQGTAVIKNVRAGESFTSLLSFIDVLTGHPAPYKTVQAQAQVDSIVLRLSMEAFVPVFTNSPELLMRVVQMVMARVQRVIFTGLHNYLGLSRELMGPITPESSPMSSAPAGSLAEELAMAEQYTAVNTSTTSSPRVSLSYSSHLDEGVRGMATEMGLEDGECLRKMLELRTLEMGDIVLTERSHGDVALGYIVQGGLTMTQSGGLDGQDELFTVSRGECFGQLATITGEANFYTCTATQPTLVAILSKEAFFTIVVKTPEVVLSLAHATIRVLSPLVRKIDFALDWITVESGRRVDSHLERGGGSTFLVLSGRLRGYTHNNQSGEKQLCGEYSRGDMMGLVEVITRVRKRKFYLSVRDSELCVIPQPLLEFLKSRSMVVMAKLISILGNRLVTGPTAPGEESTGEKQLNVRYTSVAVVPSRPSTPALAFCLELQAALTAQSGRVARLSSSIVQAKLGPTALEPAHDYRLNSWLGQQEDRNHSVIYQCDPTATPWTQKCLRHADLVLVVAQASHGPEVTAMEKELDALSVARRIRKELVLLWADGTLHPLGTKDWLKLRPWLSAHTHLKIPPRMMRYKSEAKVEAWYRNPQNQSGVDIHSDFSRLARALGGASIGLVLGGGGARGAAHLGMLKAIVEAGIPIDKVGGVSIGAFMSGLWSLHRDLATVSQSCGVWFEFMQKKSNLMDLTYPITSLFSGAYFNWSIKEAFPEEISIEDLWLPFYCVSTDISTSTERVHRSGTLWRYVRASMSYAWILPPICDPIDGHLLMDGCYVNNVPGDVMLRSACSHIIVVDVTAPDDVELTNYGDALSGWYMLWKKWNPFTSAVKIPTQNDIQERLAFCSHYKNLEALKSNPHYEYIFPPVGHFSSAKFGLFAEIEAAGYHHGATFFYGLKKAGRSSSKQEGGGDTHSWLPTADRARKATRAAERRDSGSYSFTDLAQMMVSGAKAGKEWKGRAKASEEQKEGGDEEESDDTGVIL